MIYIRGKELPDVLREEEGIEDAVAKAQYANANSRLRRLLESREKEKRDEINRRLEAWEEGKAEGEMEGEGKGEAKGRREVARKMKEKGFDTGTITEITGLSEEEIEKL